MARPTLASTLPACEPIRRIVPIAIRQNDSEHYRILCDILAVFLPPSSAKKLNHQGNSPAWALIDQP
jgi:hypothetical protein